MSTTRKLIRSIGMFFVAMVAVLLVAVIAGSISEKLTEIITRTSLFVAIAAAGAYYKALT